MAFFKRKQDKKSDPISLPSMRESPPLMTQPASAVSEPVPVSGASVPEPRTDVELRSMTPAALATLRCSLGPDATVSGRLSFTKPTRLDGTLRGEVRATDLLVVGDSGFVDGAVHAVHLVVLGRVNGDVRGAERVEIAPGATLVGNVEAQYLILQEGGYLEGNCRIIPPARAMSYEPPAPVRYEPPPPVVAVQVPKPPDVVAADSVRSEANSPAAPAEADQPLDGTLKLGTDTSHSTEAADTTEAKKDVPTGSA